MTDLTLAGFTTRLDNIRNYKRAGDQAQFTNLQSGLREKGVECAIIIPLLEIVLDFDPVSDVKYQQASNTRNDQRFDFLIGTNFLVEAKQLGSRLQNHYPQIENYVRYNPDICYGLLTNGINYELWLKRDLIQRATRFELFDYITPVVKVLKFSLKTDETEVVLKGLSAFKRDIYERSFAAIAAYAARFCGRQMQASPPPKLHNTNQLDQLLKDRIRDTVTINRGVYFGTGVAPGTRLHYKDNGVEITAEVTATGTVILRKNGLNVYSLATAMNAGFREIVDLLGKSTRLDMEYKDPIDIIKAAKGVQKLFKRNLYRFDPD